MFPELFHIGSFTVRSYGACIAVAFLVGVSLAVKEATRKGMRPTIALDFGLYALLAGIVGGRIYFVAVSGWSQFRDAPLEMLRIWSGGLGIFGGLTAGVLVGVWYSRRQGIGFWRFADVFSPSLMLGIAIGRVGCFLNGCCHGVPASNRLAVVFRSIDSVARHPAQLYESALVLVAFVVLWGMRKRTSFDGFLFLLAFLLYSVIRFGVQFLRPGEGLEWAGGLQVTQVWAAAVAVGSLSMMALRSSCASRARGGKRPW